MSGHALRESRKPAGHAERAGAGSPIGGRRAAVHTGSRGTMGAGLRISRESPPQGPTKRVHVRAIVEKPSDS
jgi:hypothetical protein